MRQCETCGYPIPVEAPNRQKYCLLCAEDAFKESQKRYYKRKQAAERKRRIEAGLPIGKLDHGYYAQSLVEIGVHFGFSSERARQICSQAMNKFKRRYALIYGEYR
ncbi:hypothetical protein LCGC14_0763700 [marine sediment metagenome]|uniref:Uncharacterized protein n=1 Tax=marine sediment metagenome TaxID=412755 RepID=A0A0F9QK77_9ZZZZ